MKQTSILGLCVCLLLLLSSHLVRSQNSVNTVKFKVTYNAATETYTAYLIPDYNVPNANNPGNFEQGSTAQFTLAVPRNFILTTITDINGAWDKSPQKLGPGQPNQDWSAYALDPSLNYYAIGKSASETNYGTFSAGQPVPLFSFTGNGCFGPIQVLPANDLFIFAANQEYSLNVSNSFYSRSGQPDGGNQEPLEQFISVAGPPTSCLLANPDAATVVVGQTVIIPVLGNDRNADGTSVVDLTKVNPPALGSPAKGIAAVNPDGTVSYTANPGSSGVDVFSYTICDAGSLTICSSSTITVTITPSVTASPDAGTVSSGTGGTAVPNVTINDIVNAQPALLGAGGNATIAAVGTYPAGITLNTTTGSVSVTVGTTPGTYTLVYQLCDLLTPATCATTTATITVTPSVTASPDAGTVSSGTGGTAVANVRVNDVVNGIAASAANSTLSVVSTAPGITLNTATGSVSVAVGTTPGTYPLIYQLCDLLTPATCTTTTATITVTPSITASPDAGTVSSGTGGTAVVNVRTNDVVNGIAASAANSVLSVVSTAPGITLNTATGSVSVAMGTAPGTYTLVYQLCDLLTPATCATTTATITVTPSVTASPDAGTVSAGTGGTAVANVTTNDVVNGVAASAANSILTVVSTAPGITLNTTTGSVSVVVGTAPGTYTLVYQLCDLLTPATCATTTATITVTPSVTAAPDAGTVSSGTGGTAVANVTTNDVVNGQPATLGGTGNATIASVGSYPSGITLNTTTGSVSVAVGTTPGSYTVAYQLCDKLTTPTCTTTTAIITVTPSVTASPDAGTVSSGAGGTAVANVRINDVVNGIAASAANSVLSVVGTYPAGITLNTATGSVSVAQGTTPGTYTLVYQLCDLLTPATCATTTATITVTPSVTAAPDAGTVSSGTGGTAVANVRLNDVVNGVAASAVNSVLSVVSTAPGITLNTATGSVSVAIGTAPGTYPLIYQLCDLLTPATCTTTTATITVTPSVTAAPDAGTISSGTGGTAVANVRLNDVVNGVAASAANSVLSVVSTAPGITLNTATGSVSVIQGTAPGTYTLVYQLCDLLTPATCTTTTATITVTPSVTASPDAGTVSSGTGGIAVANVATNDVVNGLPATLGAGGNATIAAVGSYPTGITLDPATGALSVAPGTPPASYTLAYQLCDRLTSPTCATTSLVVTVGSSLTTNPDNATLVGGASVRIPILANDLNPDGSPVTDLTQVTLPLVSTPTKGQLVVNPDGSLSYSANIASSGSEVLVYSICDRLNPTVCSSATVVVTISANLSVVLSPRVYLQGALFGVAAGNPLMRDDLRARGFVPTSSPYAAQGLVALTPVGGVSSGVLSVTGSQAVVDWVFVELRSPASNTVVVDSRPALVLRSGEIVDVDGVSPLSFSAAQSGSYFVVVRHRNHLGVMTAQAVALSYTATVVDFRQSSTLTYNLDASRLINQPQVVVNQGVALWAGNALVDKEVIYQGAANDVNVISQQVINASGNVFVTPSYKLRGYFTGDINLNGEVIFQGTGNDVDFIYQNIIKNHPGNGFKQNFFKIREQLP